MKMSVGEKSVLTIPGEMAYGNRELPGFIPKNSSLVFEIELKGIHRKKGESDDGDALYMHYRMPKGFGERPEQDRRAEQGANAPTGD